MKVLITGAAGVLGQAIVSRLEQDEGLAMRLTDMAPLETPHEFVQADLSNWDQAAGLCDGVDQVLHVAAIHPWKQYTHEQYCDCNVKGCCNILQAAADAEVDRVIYTSSIAAAGYQRCPDEPLPYVESRPCRPTENLYGISKHVGEQFCEMFRWRHGLCSVWLRPGCFIPRDDTDTARYGLAFLAGYVHFTDVAMAHVLALRSDVRDEALFVTSRVPFQNEDTDALLTDAASVILKYFPSAAGLKDKGIDLPKTIPHCYSIEKAERLIGYDPKHNFGDWLAQVAP